MMNLVGETSSQITLHLRYVQQRVNYGLGMFFTVCSGNLFPIYGKLNTDAYSTVLDDSVLPTLQQSCMLDPCVQNDNDS